MRVIHVQVGFRSGLPEVSPRNSLFGAIKKSAQHQRLFRGPLGAIHSAVIPEADEVVITKHRVNAFVGLLAMRPWQERWSASEWREFLSDGVSESRLAAIRRNTHTGRPLGEAPFIRGLELVTNRILAAQRHGSPRKIKEETRQEGLAF